MRRFSFCLEKSRFLPFCALLCRISHVLRKLMKLFVMGKDSPLILWQFGPIFWKIRWKLVRVNFFTPMSAKSVHNLRHYRRVISFTLLFYNGLFTQWSTEDEAIFYFIMRFYAGRTLGTKCNMKLFVSLWISKETLHTWKLSRSYRRHTYEEVRENKMLGAMPKASWSVWEHCADNSPAFLEG